MLIFFINGFSASYTSHNISNLAYLLALGIDVGEKSSIKVSAQFSDISPSSGVGSSNENNEVILVSAEADSIFNALNLLNTYIGKEINISHCNVVVFSEEIGREGISSEIYSLINNEQIRPSVNVIISTCKAYEYLNNVKPNFEKLTVQYYDTFSIADKFTGYFADSSIGYFFNELSSKYCGSVAILGGLNMTSRNKDSDSTESSDSDESSEIKDDSTEEDIIINPDDLVAGTSSVQGKRGTENLGLAVFDNDKMCGTLTATESICHLLLINSLKSCVVLIDNPLSPDRQSSISLIPEKSSNVNVSIENDIPIISVELCLSANILSLESNVDYSSQEVLDSYSSAAKEYLENEFNNYFNKMSKEYSIDIDHFSTRALSHFLTIQDWENFNWNEKFKDAKFNVSVNINSISPMLLTRT